MSTSVIDALVAARSKGELSEQDFLAGIATASQAMANPVAEGKHEAPRRKPILVELTDDYSKGHIALWKTVGTGRRVKGLFLHIDDVDEVVAEVQALAELVREELAQS